MVPESWSAVDSLRRALDDAVKGIDNSRLVRELESTLRSPQMQSLREIEHTIRQNTSMRTLVDEQRRLEDSLASVRMSFLDTAAQITKSLGAEDLHRAQFESIKPLESTPKWMGAQQSIVNQITRDAVLPWDEIKRLAGGIAQEACMMRQLSRFCDFDRAVGALMVEPAHAAG